MRDPDTKAVVALSGGLDSCVLLAGLLHDGTLKKENVLAVSFDYGSKHGAVEQDAAIAVAGHYGVQHRVVLLHSVFSGLKSSLLRSNPEPIPEGHYEEESMRQTVVPGRNLIFASVMNAIALSEGRGEVYIGIHAGDHHIYPDCRYMFATHLNQVLMQGSDGKVRLRYPFVNMTKAEIVRRGIVYGAPFQWTRTCYTTDEVACGRCGSCVERREAFASNGMEDPIPYRYRGPLPNKPLS